MKIIYYEDGDIRIVSPAHLDADLDNLAADVVPAGTSYSIVEDDDPRVAAVARTPTLAPSLFAAVAVCIENDGISMIELAAQLSSATYEDGWIMVGFSETQSSAEYLIFAQTDVPAKVEQFKSDGYFELVFSDPVSGDPLNPGRIDIQILKVR